MIHSFRVKRLSLHLIPLFWWLGPIRRQRRGEGEPEVIWEGKSDSLRMFSCLPHPFNKTNVHSLATVEPASPKLLDMGSPSVTAQICTWTTSEVQNHIPKSRTLSLHFIMTQMVFQVIFLKSSYLFDIYTVILTGKIWCLGFASKYSTKTKCGTEEMEGKKNTDCWRQVVGTWRLHYISIFILVYSTFFHNRKSKNKKQINFGPRKWKQLSKEACGFTVGDSELAGARRWRFALALATRLWGLWDAMPFKLGRLEKRRSSGCGTNPCYGQAVTRQRWVLPDHGWSQGHFCFDLGPFLAWTKPFSLLFYNPVLSWVSSAAVNIQD